VNPPGSCFYVTPYIKGETLRRKMQPMTAAAPEYQPGCPSALSVRSTAVNRQVHLVLLCGALLPAAVAAQVDYHRADVIRTAPEQLLGVPDGWAAGFAAAIGLSRPAWLDDSTRFWYRVKTSRGAEFVLVDPTRMTRHPVFDNGRLAAALSVAADTTFDPVS